MNRAWAVAVLCAMAAGAAATEAVKDGSGIFFPERETPLYRTHHGEPPGYPGCLPGTNADGTAIYPRWGHPELELYPGSVEHYRIEFQKYLPAWAMVDAKSLVRNFRLTELDGVPRAAVEPYAEPVTYLPMYGPPRDVGRTNPPVAVVRCKPGVPVFKLDMGTLRQGLYIVRLIGAAERPYDLDIRRPVYVELKVNDGPNGEMSRYRKRCGYTEEFYSIAEFYFYTPSDRSYSAEVCLGEGSEVDILAYNIDVHDVYAGLARRVVKRRPGTFDPEKREQEWALVAEKVAANDRAWLDQFAKANLVRTVKSLGRPYREAPLSPEERSRRDEEIWYALPPLNVQTRGGYGQMPVGSGVPETTERLKSAGTWKLAGKWDSRWELTNAALNLRYTWEDLAAHKPLPEPWPVREDAGGFTFPRQSGQKHAFTMVTIADAVTDRIGKFGDQINGKAAHGEGLAGYYHLTGDREAARDAAMALVRFAYLLPTWDEGRQSVNAAVCGRSSDLNWGGKDQWTRRRLSRVNAGLNGDCLEAYDKLFDFISGNEELARAVSRFIPWVRTPEELVQFLDTNLLQLMAKRFARWHWHGSHLMTTTMLAADTEFTRPWMEFLFREDWTYPQPRAGWPDYAIGSTTRAGTSYIGSWMYAMDGGPAMEYAQRTGEYLRFGGDSRFDMSDVRRYPKALAGCYFQIEGRVAGLHPLGIGDVNGPNLTYGKWLHLGHIDQHARLGWRWSHDPRFAYILANHSSRQDESEAEWARIERAALGVPNPWFEQRSRVLPDWAAILESGTSHTDFRYRRAAMVRVGYGWGHQHDDVLDLILWCHGVIHAAVGGERPETRVLGDIHSPPNQKSYTHNMVEVDGDGSHATGGHRGYSWTRTLKDTEGARYVEADSFPHIHHPDLSIYRRQVALVDVDEGIPPVREPVDPKEFAPGFKLPKAPRTPDAYAFDVFRVRGGRRHTYCFHGCEEDEFTQNALDVKPVPFRDADGVEPTAENQYLNKFLVADSKTAGTAPDVLRATWRLQRGGPNIAISMLEKDGAGRMVPKVVKEMKRENTEQQILGVNYDPESPRKYTRLHLLEQRGARVMTGKWVATSPNVSLQCLFVQRENTNGLESVFPAVVEMYEGSPVISNAALAVVKDNESDALRAAAVALDLADGRRDLCFADGRPERTREVFAPFLAAPLRASGRFAYYSADAGGLRQATLVGGTILDVPDLSIRADWAERTGVVVRVDYFEKRAVVEGMPLENAALLKGASVEVGSPEHRTSYMVRNAAVEDNRLALTFDKGMDYYSARVTAVDEAAREVICGLAFPTDDGVVYPGVDKNLVASNEQLTKFWRVEYRGGTPDEGYRFRLDGPVTSADFGEKGGLRVWEFGVGDRVCVPTHVSVRRIESGLYELQADTACTLTLPCRTAEISADGQAWRPIEDAGAAESGRLAMRVNESRLAAGTVRLRVR